MAARFWIMITVAVLLVVLGVVAFLMTRKKKTLPDYYALFIMGVVWLPLGIATKKGRE